jgi:uncharacterized membrane protein
MDFYSPDEKENTMKKIFSVSSILIDLVTAFLLMSILFFLRSDTIEFFYTLRHLLIADFYAQVLVWVVFFIVLTLSRIWIRFLNRGVFLTIVGLVFIALFSQAAPTVSLSTGSLILAVPFLFGAIYAYEEQKNKSEKKWVTVLNLCLLSLAGLLFVLVVLIFCLKTPQFFPIYPHNDSQIGDAMLYSDFQKNLWKISIEIFLVMVLLYGVVKLFKLDRKIGKLSQWLSLGVVFIVLFTSVIWLSLVMVYRTKAVCTPTYDFGIFTQMFYNMANFKGMVTTLERGIALSHLSVHFSPIYYLMLPPFLIFPYPETLQVLQVLTLASGIVPLYFIMKHLKTPPLFRTLIFLMYLVHPALITSGYYDLHENCFLAPMLLTLLYFCIKRQWIGVLVFTVLSLMIKEDSILYVALIGLYVVFSKKLSESTKKNSSILMGSFMIAISLLYFFTVRSFLEDTGEGAMFWRYDNLMVYPETGLLGIVIGIFQNPTYFFATLFSPAKMTSFLWVIASLGFLPLLVKKPADFLLAVPYVVMNLASNYRYQSEFGFQYFYGSVSMLVFMAILAEYEHRNSPATHYSKVMKHLLVLCAFFGFSVGVIVSGESAYARRYDMENYLANPTQYDSIRSSLISIPEDKVVVGTGLLTTYLGDRYLLYDFDYYAQHEEIEDIDYLVIDRRLEEASLNRFVFICENRGFVLSELSTEYLIIYESADSE